MHKNIIQEIFKTGREENINNVKYKPCALTATCKSISVMKKMHYKEFCQFYSWLYY